MTLRKDVFKYVKKKYSIEADYPLPTAPTFPVLRHEDNRKWFALIMEVLGEKLGFHEEGLVEIINVKLGDHHLVDILTQQEGYFSGYHISRGNWISILLDGTVPLKKICEMIDESFFVTAFKQKKQEIRPPKEWLVPANPKYYDIEHAFEQTDEIDWKQGNGIKRGDIVFLYAAAPVSAILYKCSVTKTDIPYNYMNKNLKITALMKVKLIKRYKSKIFTFETLKDKYGVFAIRGPRGIPYDLSEALKK